MWVEAGLVSIAFTGVASARDFANVAYLYTQALRQAQAAVNLGDVAASSILGLLPTPV